MWNWYPWSIAKVQFLKKIPDLHWVQQSTHTFSENSFNGVKHIHVSRKKARCHSIFRIFSSISLESIIRGLFVGWWMISWEMKRIWLQFRFLFSSRRRRQQQFVLLTQLLPVPMKRETSKNLRQRKDIFISSYCKWTIWWISSEELSYIPG